VLLAVPLVGWLYWEYGVKAAEQRYFESKIPALIAAGEKGLPLKELTNFDWDMGCVIGPYSGFSRELHDGGKYENYKLEEEVYSDSDGQWYIVFVLSSHKKLIAVRPSLLGGIRYPKSFPSGMKCNVDNGALIKVKKDNTTHIVINER